MGSVWVHARRRPVEALEGLLSRIASLMKSFVQSANVTAVLCDDCSVEESDTIHLSSSSESSRYAVDS